MNSHISWLKEWQHGAKSCSKPIQQTYFTQNGVEISQDVSSCRSFCLAFMRINNTADHCNAGSTMCFTPFASCFICQVFGRTCIFSYSIATKLLTGVARLFFEASGNLQTPLTGRTISKKREVATHNALVSIIWHWNIIITSLFQIEPNWADSWINEQDRRYSCLSYSYQLVSRFYQLKN